MVSFGFEQMIGWLAFLSLIPLILLYLIRPKPKEIDVPSLMFFQRDEKRKRERAFFQRLRKDWLFLLQLLALLLLSLFFIQPYLILDKGLLLETSVLVVDASASTGVGKVFEKVIEEAKDVVGKKNTVVMVSTTPYVALDNEDKKTTLQFLDELRVGATASPIGSALALAGQYVSGTKPEIFVISDFMDTGSTSFAQAKASLESRGVLVHVIDVGEETSSQNIGIIQVKPRVSMSDVMVKNFMTIPQSIEMDINGQQRTLALEPLGSEIVSFPTTKELTKVVLHTQDDLSVDDVAYVSIPSSKKVNALLLSDKPSRYLKAALTSADDIALDVSARVPPEKYDVYILQQATLHPQEIRLLEEDVREGASVVVHAQQDMQQASYGSLLPVVLGERRGYGVIEEAQPNKFTKDIEFGGVQQHFAVKEDKGITLLHVANNSVLSLQTIDGGKVAYYGILESASDFSLNPGYPIFWVNFVRYLGNARTLSDVNRQGGSVMTFPEKVTVKTPSRSVYAQALYLHEPGVYEVGDDQIVVNLAHEKESSLTPLSTAEQEQIASSRREGVKQNLDDFLLWAVVVFLFLELLLTKGRGEM